MSACSRKVCNNPEDYYSSILCCVDCKQYFHSPCVTIGSMSNKDKRKWKCEDCKVKKATDSAQPTDTTSRNNPENLCSDSRYPDGEFRRPNDVLQSTERESNGLGEVEEEINRTKKSFEYLSIQYNELSDKLTNIEVQVKFHTDKLNKYTGDVSETKKSLYMLGQSLRNNRIEIHGLELPHTLTCSNIKSKIVEVSKAFGIKEFSGEDIDIVYTLPAKNGLPQPIVVQFKSRSMRNMWISKRKTFVTNSDLPGGLNTSRIYINENLGSFFKCLWYEARTLAKEKGYKFVWVKEGKLYIRQNETTAATRIRSKEDLDKLRNDG